MSTDNESTPLALSDEDRLFATIAAMSIRKALEGTLHGGELGPLSLTDEQMRLLNPILRSAVATALHARSHYDRSYVARSYLDFQLRLVPAYWERAELLPSYVEDWGWKAAP